MARASVRRRIFEAEEEQPCKTCGALKGELCKTKSGKITDYPHAARHDAWCATKGKVAEHKLVVRD